MLKIFSRHPSERLLQNLLTIQSPTIVLQDDSRIQNAFVVVVEKIARGSDAKLYHHHRIFVAQLPQQQRKLCPDHMVTHADHQFSAPLAERTHRVSVRRYERVCRRKKRVAVYGQSHVTRGPLHEPPPKLRLETLDAQADRGLRRVQHMRRTGKAFQIGDQHKSLNGFYIKTLHSLSIKNSNH